MRPARALAAAPLLALLVAGCLSGGEPLVPADGAVAIGALRFAEPLAMAQERFGSEPNIAVLPDGTLFIAAVVGDAGGPNVQQGAAYLWRSRDGGATWDTLRQPGPLAGTAFTFCSCDADVVGSPDGWVYYTDWWIAPPFLAGNYLVERSGDGGDTWASTPMTIPVADGMAIDRQWLYAGANGLVGLAYAYYHPVQNQLRALGDLEGRGETLQTIAVMVSTDHGASWSGPFSALPAVPGKFHLHGKPAVYPDGATVAMAFGETPIRYLNDPSRVGVALSDDGGRSWRTRWVADVPEGFESVWPVQGAVGPDGVLHVVWNARTGPTVTLFHSSSADMGSTWSAPKAIRAEGINALPWVAARAGEVAAGWYGGDATGDPRDAPADAAWYAYAARSPDGGATWSLARVSEEPVKTGPFCALGARCPEDRELLDYVSLIHDPEGRLHYAYARSEDAGRTARVLYAGQALPLAG